jgi:hypothetical protein
MIDLLVDGEGQTDLETMARVNMMFLAIKGEASVVDWQICGVVPCSTPLSQDIKSGAYAMGTMRDRAGLSRTTYPIEPPYWIDILSFDNTGSIVVALCGKGIGTVRFVELDVDAFVKAYDALLSVVPPGTFERLEAHFGENGSNERSAAFSVAHGYLLLDRFFPDLQWKAADGEAFIEQILAVRRQRAEDSAADFFPTS